MMPFFYVGVILLIAVNLLLGFGKGLNLVQQKIASLKVADSQIASEPKAPSLPRSKNISPPQVSATSVFIKDLNTQAILYTKDAQKRVPIASTTKIMTALVAADYFSQSSILTVSPFSLVEGSSMGLKVGEQLTFRSLLYGMMLNSGNDAAFTIAANYPGGIENFIKRMNDKALELGLTDTYFDNPAGFDSPNHYSSASDLGKIASLASENSQLSWVVSTKETTVASVDKSTIHPLRNLNKLLGLPGILGMKTGTTPLAKENLVGLAEKDGQKILTVVLGSEDRFGETQSLLSWVESNFQWKD